jgi:hypothetical protein
MGEKNKEFLSFISKKKEWESPPSILVTRKLNWSYILDKKTNYVKEMY